MNSSVDNLARLASQWSPIIEQFLFDQHLPLLARASFDQIAGGCYERLSAQAKGQNSGQRRLLTQCRMLFVFSQAYRLRPHAGYARLCQQIYRFLLEHYEDQQHGGWIFSLNDQCQPKETHKDAYGMAFVIFALAHCYNTFKQPEALTKALAALDWMLTHMRDDQHGGFFEACDSSGQPIAAMRRQNPHMHLIEALGELQQASYSRKTQDVIDELGMLFRQRFRRGQPPTLREFFQDNWQPDLKKGNVVEAGHHFEWYWLLTQPSLTNNSFASRDAFFQWALQYGWDKKQGGFFDEISPAGELLSANKRIWPLTEFLKASAYQAQQGHTEACQWLDRALKHLFSCYLQPNGGWHEHVNQHNQSIRKDMPLTTPYHLVLAFAELLKVFREETASI